MLRNDEMFKSIMKEWNDCTEDFIKFEERNGLIICAWGWYEDCQCDVTEHMHLFAASSYEKIFKEEFKDAVIELMQESVSWEEFGYFSKEEYDFLKDFYKEDFE